MEQLTISREGYIELKQKIKEKLNETVSGFIIIGYYLKQVRDSGAYRTDGYKNIEEFARCEYRLSASTASRFMDINTEFSKDGNSLEIKEEYRNYAYSKLQEMLTVSPEDRELITEATTVKQIREIKAAEKEEEKAAEEERQNNLPLMQTEESEPAGAAVPAEENTAAVPADPFEAVITAFWQENTEIYTKAAAGMLTPEIVAEEICPSGSRTYRSGTSMLFFYDFDKGIKLRSIDAGKPCITPYAYRDFLERTQELNLMPEHAEEEKTQEGPEQGEGYQEEPPATSQGEQYAPLPGQLSISGLQDTAGSREPAVTGQEENRSAAADMQAHAESVIDAEYRELGGEKKESGIEPYTDIEIKNAAGFFEMEYNRMTLTGQETAKKRNYKIALDCIHRCFPASEDRQDNRPVQGKEHA